MTYAEIEPYYEGFRIDFFESDSSDSKKSVLSCKRGLNVPKGTSLFLKNIGLLAQNVNNKKTLKEMSGQLRPLSHYHKISEKVHNAGMPAIITQSGKILSVQGSKECNVYYTHLEIDRDFEPLGRGKFKIKEQDFMSLEILERDTVSLFIGREKISEHFHQGESLLYVDLVNDDLSLIEGVSISNGFLEIEEEKRYLNGSVYHYNKILKKVVRVERTAEEEEVVPNGATFTENTEEIANLDLKSYSVWNRDFCIPTPNKEYSNIKKGGITVEIVNISQPAPSWEKVSKEEEIKDEFGQAYYWMVECQGKWFFYPLYLEALKLQEERKKIEREKEAITEKLLRDISR